jgi:hypothetical protein
MTGALAPTELRLRLPGQWWTADLTDRSAALAAAGRLIRHRIGTQDDRAPLRARLHHDFAAAIDRAIEGEGRRMLLAIEIAEGVPLPIAITIFAPSVDFAPSIGTDPDRVLDVLERGMLAGDHGTLQERESIVRVVAADSRAIRTVDVRTVEVGSGNDRGDLEIAIVRYWIAVPGAKRVVLVDCSCSYASLVDELVVFFDALMRVAAWASTGEHAETPSAVPEPLG